MTRQLTVSALPSHLWVFCLGFFLKKQHYVSGKYIASPKRVVYQIRDAIDHQKRRSVALPG